MGYVIPYDGSSNTGELGYNKNFLLLCAADWPMTLPSTESHAVFVACKILVVAYIHA